MKSEVPRGLASIIFCLIAVLLSCGESSLWDDVPREINPNWVIEDIDRDIGSSGKSISFDIDGNDGLHISYYDDKDVVIKYAYYNGNTWAITEIDSDIGYYSDDTSISVDSSNNPHIAYHEEGNDDLRYAYHNGISWVIETVDSDGNTGRRPVIGIDSNDNPHIFYGTEEIEAIRYAHRNGSEWITETVTTGTAKPFYCSSMIIDSLDRFHLACLNADYGNETWLAYVSYDGDYWNTEIIDEGCGEWGGYTSIAIDNSGHPCISYHAGFYENEIISGLRYAVRTPSGWVIEQVERGVGKGYDTSLAFDSTGTPLISYTDFFTYDYVDLMYATKVNGKWQRGYIDLDLNFHGGNTNIEFDLENTPHIIYWNCREWAVKHAYCPR